MTVTCRKLHYQKVHKLHFSFTIIIIIINISSSSSSSSNSIIIIIIIIKKKGNPCIQMNVSIPADRNVPQKTAETKTQGFLYRDTTKVKNEIITTTTIIIAINQLTIQRH